MSTMASQWAQLVAQMGAEGSNAIAQGFNAGNASANTNIKQQQQDMQERQQLQQAHQADLDFHQKMLSIGANPVVNGMVQDQQQVPDTTGLNNGYPSSVSVVRKADPQNTVKWSDAAGNPMSYELPPLHQQIMTQLANQQPVEDSAARQAGSVAQATAAGTAAGAPRVATTPAYNTQMQLPPGMTSIPESTATGLAERSVPANYRYLGTTQAADTRAKSATDVANIRAKTAQDLQDLQDAHFQAHEGDQNKWEAAKIANEQYLSGLTTGRAKMTQDATDARNFRDNFARNMQLHATLSKNVLGEQQKQIAAQGLAQTPDGENFVDPFDGKSKVMNSAQRLILRQRHDASVQSSTGMQGTLNQLEQQRDNILTRMGGGAASPAAIPGG